MELNVDKFLTFYGIGGIALIGVLALGLTGFSSPGNVESSNLQNVDATVYKSPNCGCCAAWAQYAERQGMDITVEEVRNLDKIKQEQKIPSQLESCHTTVLDDYVVEGHVPVNGIEKLLTESPEVQGIALPGMPQGSPGMPGQKQSEWKISSFTETSEISEFMTV